jgi:hypothetical protein
MERKRYKQYRQMDGRKKKIQTGEKNERQCVDRKKKIQTR